MKYVQIQGVFVNFSEIAVNLIEGLYSTVARFYDFLLNIVVTTNVDMYGDAILSFAQLMYLLVGIFMLFRIVLSLINYIINPSDIGDKNRGPSKLLVNIVVAIILLLAFYPGGLVFRFLDEVEDAIIGTGDNKSGFIDRLMASSEIDTSAINAGVSETSSPGAKTDNSAKLTCYYYRTASNTCTTHSGAAGGTATTYKSTYPWFVKISFYDKKVGGAKKVSNANVYYKVYSGSETLKVGSNSMYTFKYHSNFRTYDVISTGTSCRVSKSDYSSIKYISNGSTSFPTKCTQVAIIEGNNFPVEEYTGVTNSKKLAFVNETKNSDFIGRKNPKDLWDLMVKDYAEYREKIDEISGNEELNESLENDIVARELKVDQNAIDFANGAARIFYTCNDSDDGTCEQLLSNIFTNNEEIAKSVGDKKIYMDFFASIIAAIAIIIFFTLLSVTVVIRNLKLMLLQMLAPIAFICGVNPNDKIRNRWFTMYFATYLELFLYLFSIKLVLSMLAMGIVSDQEGIAKIFVIIGLLMFAKLVPSFISKLFGLDVGGGTFKEAAGMLKAGAGVAAAGALLAPSILGSSGARAVSAWQNADVTGLDDKAARGKKLKNALLAGGMGLGAGLASVPSALGAGAKGKVVAGASKNIEGAKNAMAAYSSGLSPTDILQASTLGRVGMSAAQRIDRRQRAGMAEIEDMGKGGERFDKMKSTAKDTKLYGAIANYRDSDGNYMLDDTKRSKFADTIAEASLMDEASGTQHIENWLNNNAGGWWRDAHSGGLWEGKEAGIIKSASAEYESFIANSASIQNLLSDTNTLNRMVASGSIDQDTVNAALSQGVSYKKEKAINGIVSAYIRERGTEMQIERDKPSYVASKAANDARGGNK